MDGLLPINPKHYASYYAGSIYFSEFDDFSRYMEPLDTIENILEYLDTARSDSEYLYRVARVVKDTMTVNFMRELDTTCTVGPFMASRYASWCVEQYVTERILTHELNDMEELYLLEFKQYAKECGFNPDKVFGTGIFRENVPPYLQSSIFSAPNFENSRPKPAGFIVPNDDDEGNNQFSAFSPSNKPNPGDDPIWGLDGVGGQNQPGSGSSNFGNIDSNIGDDFTVSDSSSIFGQMPEYRRDYSKMPSGRSIKPFAEFQAENEQNLALLCEETNLENEEQSSLTSSTDDMVSSTDSLAETMASSVAKETEDLVESFLTSLSSNFTD